MRAVDDRSWPGGSSRRWRSRCRSSVCSARRPRTAVRSRTCWSSTVLKVEQIAAKSGDSEGIPTVAEEAAYQAWADGLAERAAECARSRPRDGCHPAGQPAERVRQQARLSTARAVAVTERPARPRRRRPIRWRPSTARSPRRLPSSPTPARLTWPVRIEAAYPSCPRTRRPRAAAARGPARRARRSLAARCRSRRASPTATTASGRTPVGNAERLARRVGVEPGHRVRDQGRATTASMVSLRDRGAGVDGRVQRGLLVGPSSAHTRISAPAACA